MQQITITGASGFVGQHLTHALLQHGYPVQAIVRDAGTVQHFNQRYPSLFQYTVITDLAKPFDWVNLLRDTQCLVHAAARVHHRHEAAGTAELAYQSTNVFATAHLAQAAAQAKVPHFIFLSSIKVNGERTLDQAFSEQDCHAPADPYARSKLAAEQALWQICDVSSLTATILRPPLIYGPGVKANFLSLMQTVDKQIPLPFGAINNRRDLLFVGNLVDIILQFIQAPPDQSSVYCICDRHPLSTADLIANLAQAMGKSTRRALIPVPPSLLKAGFRLLRRPGLIDRLLNNLEINSNKLSQQRTWQPKYSLGEAFEHTAKWAHAGYPAAWPEILLAH